MSKTEKNLFAGNAAGTAVTGWAIYCYDDPEKGIWAPVSFEQLLDFLQKERAGADAPAPVSDEPD